MSEREVLAEKKFVASGDGKTFDVVLQLVPSGAFEYGNRHALLYTVDNYTQCFDARYDKRFNTVESFNANAYEFVREHIRDEFDVRCATAQFEVGKWYNPSESGYDPIKVVRRTQKYVFFENGDGNRWRMMLRTDEDGNEFVRDSTYPDRWQGAFTYNAKWEVAV